MLAGGKAQTQPPAAGTGRALDPGRETLAANTCRAHRAADRAGSLGSLHVASPASSAWRLMAKGVLTCLFQPRIQPTWWQYAHLFKGISVKGKDHTYSKFQGGRSSQPAGWVTGKYYHTWLVHGDFAYWWAKYKKQRKAGFEKPSFKVHISLIPWEFSAAQPNNKRPSRFGPAFPSNGTAWE